MPFTKRELCVLHLLSQGLRIPAIAKQLNVSTATARAHRANIARKLKGTGFKVEDLSKLSPEFIKELENLK